MQSWADIASDSDDDSVGMHHPAKQQPQAVQEEQPETEEQVHEEEEEEVVVPPKEYTWPTDPPFTAYVGNLPYSVKESEELSLAIEDLLHDRFQVTVRIAKSRLAIDRHDNRPRGFGYVEVETVDDLKTVMRLNDGKSMFKGRPLKLDVASPPSRKSLNRSSSQSSQHSNVDGSSFRGGRYNTRRDSSSSLRRQSSISSETSETKQRPSLKLAPRSKPTTEGDDQNKGEASSSQSSLFGGGKARDEGEWERRRSETKQQQQQDRRGSASSTGAGGQDRRGSASSTGGQDRRGSASSTSGGGGGRGRGNKGRGGGSKSGRGGGRGRGKEGSKKNVQKDTKPKEKEADSAPKAVLKQAPAAAAEPATKPATTKVQNKFSALNMDSDSD